MHSYVSFPHLETGVWTCVWPRGNGCVHIQNCLWEKLFVCLLVMHFDFLHDCGHPQHFISKLKFMKLLNNLLQFCNSYTQHCPPHTINCDVRVYDFSVLNQSGTVLDIFVFTEL